MKAIYLTIAVCVVCAFSSHLFAEYPSSDPFGSFHEVVPPAHIREYSDHRKVTFFGDVLILDRHDDVGGPFFYDFNSIDYFDPSTYQSVMDLSAVDAGTEAGFRLSLTLHEDDGSATEISGFSMQKFGQTATITQSTPVTFVLMNIVPANPENSYSLEYSSRFRGVELNRKREFGCRFTGIAGIKFVDLSDGFNVHSAGGTFETGVVNELYGLQLGGDIVLVDAGWASLVSTLKGGVFWNHAHVTGAAVNVGSGGFTRFIDTEDETAFVGDLQLGALVPMGPQANLRIGYQAYFLDGVGIGPNQIGSYQMFQGTGSLTTSEVWFHGGYVGIEMFW